MDVLLQGGLATHLMDVLLHGGLGRLGEGLATHLMDVLLQGGLATHLVDVLLHGCLATHLVDVLLHRGLATHLKDVLLQGGLGRLGEGLVTHLMDVLAPNSPSASSKTKMASWCLASWKMASMFFVLSPTHLLSSSPQLTTFRGFPTSYPIASATRVLPVPGAPWRRKVSPWKRAKVNIHRHTDRQTDRYLMVSPCESPLTKEHRSERIHVC